MTKIEVGLGILYREKEEYCTEMEEMHSVSEMDSWRQCFTWDLSHRDSWGESLRKVF